MTPDPESATARDLLDKLKIPMVLVAMVLMYAAGQVEEVRPLVARVVVFGVPLIAVAYTAVGLLDTHPLLKSAGLALAGVSLASALWVGAGLFQQRTPLAKIELTSDTKKSIQLADGTQEVELAVHGKLIRADKGSVVLSLAQGTQVQVLEHEFVRHAVGKQGAKSIQHAWRQRVAVQGSGPVELALTHADADLKLPLLVELLPPPAYPVLPRSGLLVLGALAIVVQGLVARRGIRARLAAGVAVALAFASYAPQLVDPERPYDGVFGLLVAAMLAAGAGLLAGYVVTRLAKRSALDA